MWVFCCGMIRSGSTVQYHLTKDIVEVKMGGAAKRALRSASVPRLFEPEEMVLRPSGTARLLALARASKPTASEREKRREQDLKMILRLRAWGADLGRRFGLHYRSLDPERDGGGLMPWSAC